MIQRRALSRKKQTRQHRLEDEKGVGTRPARVDGDRLGLLALQQQVGNQAVQRVLAQRRAEDQAGQNEAKGQAEQKETEGQTEQNEEEAKELVEIGQVKIEKPEIKEYEVSGNSLSDVADQILPSDEWYEYEYQYEPKIENETVTQIDVTVMVTLHVPKWTGGWEQVPETDKLTWLKILQNFFGGPEEYEDVTLLPQQWLGPGWEEVPDTLKGEWQEIQLEFQSNEKGPIDIARRRVMILQQRLFNQPEKKVKEIFDLFQEDIKIEDEAYKEQREFGKEQEIVLDPDVLLR